MNKNINVLFLKHVDQEYMDYHIEACEKNFDKCISLNYADYFLKSGMSGLHREISRLIKAHNIKLIFITIFWNNFQLPPEFLNKMRSNCRLVFWLFDDETFLHAHTKYFAQTADFIISTDTLGQSFYEAIGIPTYRYASFFPSTLYCPDYAIERDIDVSFVGAVQKGHRMEYLKFLLENNIKLQCWGLGTKRGKVTLEEMIQIFRRSKINLNFVDMSMFDWICERFPLSPRIKQKKGRQIEIALTDSFCLQEDCPDLKYYFKPNEEMVVFKNKEEMLEKIKYYLNNESERKKICREAYEKSIQNYSGETCFPKMFGAMLDTITQNEKNRQSRLTIYYDSFYRKQFAAFLWLYALLFLKRGRLKIALETFSLLYRQPCLAIIRGALFAIQNKNPSEISVKFKEPSI